jgi:hypothetical protein
VQSGEILSKKLCAQLLAGLFLAGAVSVSGNAQTAPRKDEQPSTQPPIQEEPPAPGKPVEANGTGKAAPAGTSNDRLFYTLPNFLSLENAKDLPPLTTKQKFAVVARGSFDYVEVPWYGFLSAISQAGNSEPGYGQGWAGYGKRYASAVADGTIENFITSAILPSILHQDPRFFQSDEGGFARKTEYAVSRIFVTRTDSGGTQFNYSEIVGSAMSAAISTYSYHPRSKIVSTPSGPRFIPSDRTIANAASVWGSQVGYDTVTIVVKEFWPDIHRKLSHKPRVGGAQVNPPRQETSHLSN